MLRELLVQARTATEEAGYDQVIEVPVALVAEETGYRHDALSFGDQKVFALLVAPTQVPVKRRVFFRQR